MLRKWTLSSQLGLMDRLVQEHRALEQDIGRIADLAEDLGMLSEIQDISADLTLHQYNFINRRRVELRQYIVNLQEGLQSHFNLEEKAFQSALSEKVYQTIKDQHQLLLRKLSEIDELLLSLSPAGILFNGQYVQQKIEKLQQTIGRHIDWEGRLMELIEFYSCGN